MHSTGPPNSVAVGYPRRFAPRRPVNADVRHPCGLMGNPTRILIGGAILAPPLLPLEVLGTPSDSNQSFAALKRNASKWF